MQRMLLFIGIMFGVMSLFSKRYRVINAFLSKRWLRRLSVALVMRIPAIRQKMMYQMLR
ncbi:sodium:proton antiporter [Evansella sp. AB-P1]|uniref:sodium:proton antiporter n=1 Tax=Evansella sp. AB-P1 TaxID=3037653 RepID=UPI00241F8743|nr:sodium:proton antiporter [Evansella sp. AB-P1]MDG5788745.1 sodium:proton antiporter [Evansella sp. AB-P1]